METAQPMTEKDELVEVVARAISGVEWDRLIDLEKDDLIDQARAAVDEVLRALMDKAFSEHKTAVVNFLKEHSR